MALSGLRKSRKLNSRDFAAFRRLELIARTVVEGFVSGQHKSPFKGFAIEFQEHRDYVPGDDLKHLDWKVLAKSDRYYIKQYEEDTALRAYLVLDISGSMNYGSEGRTKLECGRLVAAILAYMLTGQEDAVGLVTCSSTIHTFLTPRSTKMHLKSILDTLGEAHSSDDTGLGNVLHSLANRIKRRGLIVIISDLFDDADDIVHALNHFAHKKHEAIVIQILDRKEATFPFRDMTQFESLEGDAVELTDPIRLRREYVAQFNAHQKQVREACHGLRIDFLQLFTDEPIERTLARYLVERLRR
jgi:uncharacterized protein (DUF58 family)